MTDFAGIVRPFADGRVSPPRQYFQVGQIGVPPLILRYGRSGNGKVMNGSFSSNETVYMTQYENEQKTADFGTSF